MPAVFTDTSCRLVLHLVDTPGHVDFRAEVLSSYRSTDSALLLVDASQGVQGSSNVEALDVGQNQLTSALQHRQVR
jgi:translation elongation factor EF-4